MLPASTVPKSGQVSVSHHCRVSSMTYSLHLNMMIRQMVSRGWVYPLRVSRFTYTAPKIERKHLTLRTRIKRLVRKTICFSKSIQMHDTVIGLFVNRYAFG